MKHEAPVHPRESFILSTVQCQLPEPVLGEGNEPHAGKEETTLVTGGSVLSGIISLPSTG